MTTSTFADLKSQVAAAAQRSNLTAQIPFFVQQAETRIYYGSEEQPFPTETPPHPGYGGVTIRDL
jgi:hypothetical protein